MGNVLVGEDDGDGAREEEGDDDGDVEDDNDEDDSVDGALDGADSAVFECSGEMHCL